MYRTVYNPFAMHRKVALGGYVQNSDKANDTFVQYE